MDERRQRRDPWLLIAGRRTTDVLNRFNALFGHSDFGAHFRNLWLLLITVVVLLAIGAQEGALRSQARGRRFVIAVNCATISAVAEAGRDVIASPANQPETPFDRALEGIGYPPRPQRVQQAKLLSTLYVQHIVSLVARHLASLGEVKHPHALAVRLVQSDGTINCGLLQSLGRASAGSPGFP